MGNPTGRGEEQVGILPWVIWGSFRLSQKVYTANYIIVFKEQSINGISGFELASSGVLMKYLGPPKTSRELASVGQPWSWDVSNTLGLLCKEQNARLTLLRHVVWCGL